MSRYSGKCEKLFAKLNESINKEISHETERQIISN